MHVVFVVGRAVIVIVLGCCWLYWRANAVHYLALLLRPSILHGQIRPLNAAICVYKLLLPIDRKFYCGTFVPAKPLPWHPLYHPLSPPLQATARWLICYDSKATVWLNHFKTSRICHAQPRLLQFRVCVTGKFANVCHKHDRLVLAYVRWFAETRSNSNVVFHVETFIDYDWIDCVCILARRHLSLTRARGWGREKSGTSGSASLNRIDNRT